MLTRREEAEIGTIAERLGTPLRSAREFRVQGKRGIAWVKKLTRRRGEIILVIPRPNGRVLLHTKPTYPEGIYRLPSGGVNPGEAIIDAALREAMEETGFDVPLSRFLGVVDNVLIANDDHLSYPSYILSTMQTVDAPRVMDPSEEISGFREIPLGELSRIAAQLEAMPPDWQPWGQLRATPHTVALTALERNH